MTQTIFLSPGGDFGLTYAVKESRVTGMISYIGSTYKKQDGKEGNKKQAKKKMGGERHE
jgi:hypothetical protein